MIVAITGLIIVITVMTGGERSILRWPPSRTERRRDVMRRVSIARRVHIEFNGGTDEAHSVSRG